MCTRAAASHPSAQEGYSQVGGFRPGRSRAAGKCPVLCTYIPATVHAILPPVKASLYDCTDVRLYLFHAHTYQLLRLRPHLTPSQSSVVRAPCMQGHFRGGWCTGAPLSTCVCVCVRAHRSSSCPITWTRGRRYSRASPCHRAMDTGRASQYVFTTS